MDNGKEQEIQEYEDTNTELTAENETGQTEEISESEEVSETDNLTLFMELEKQAYQEREELKEQLEIISQNLELNNEKTDRMIEESQNKEIQILLEEQNEYLSVMSQTTEEEPNINDELSEIETVQLYGNVSIIVILFLMVIALLYKLIQNIFSVLTRHIG